MTSMLGLSNGDEAGLGLAKLGGLAGACGHAGVCVRRPGHPGVHCDSQELSVRALWRR